MSDTEGFAALITVAIAWAGFAAFGRRKKWSGVIRHGGGFVAGLFTLVMGVILFAPGGPDTSPVADATMQPRPVAAAEKQTGMGISPVQFADRWNSISQDKIGTIEFAEGAEKIELARNQALLLNSKNESGLVDGAMFMFAPQTDLEALNAMINVAAIIGSTNPELAPNQRGEIMKRLRMTGDDADYEFADGKRTRTHVVGSVKYYFMQIAGLLVFGAEAPD